jgi:glycerol-3-phosphate dehydrogenase
MSARPITLHSIGETPDAFPAMKRRKAVNATINCDVLVVGGGLHGAAIARDAAGRGLSVVLCERGDLAEHASPLSVGLVHGMLRYLEGHDFSVVRHALAERNLLMHSAPHLFAPLRFAMPRDAGHRPPWAMRLELLACNRMAQQPLLPAARLANLLQHVTGGPLRLEFGEGMLFSDARVDEARLVLLNAMSAVEAGATVLTRTLCDSAQRRDGRWQATLCNASGASLPVLARAMVNATGPWAARFLHQATGHPQPQHLVKRSQFLVRKKFGHGYGYRFQDPDGQTVFALPFEQDYTLITATSEAYDGDPAGTVASDAEIHKLCSLVNRYFTAPVGPADVVLAWSGAFALPNGDAAQTAAPWTYQLRLDGGEAPLLSVLGGGLSTFRLLAEDALNRLAPRLGRYRGAWTAGVPLPGGDLVDTAHPARHLLAFDDYVRLQKQAYLWAPPALIDRYARAYGSRMHRLLDGCKQMQDLGAQVLPGLFEAELRYLVQHEWAMAAEDILWRRSRLGLHLPPDAAQKVEQWMAGAMQRIS